MSLLDTSGDIWMHPLSLDSKYQQIPTSLHLTFVLPQTSTNKSQPGKLLFSQSSLYSWWSSIAITLQCFKESTESSHPLLGGLMDPTLLSITSTNIIISKQSQWTIDQKPNSIDRSKSDNRSNSTIDRSSKFESYAFPFSSFEWLAFVSLPTHIGINHCFQVLLMWFWN